MRILSVDWDFFFPELSHDPKLWGLYDWGHRDGGSIFTDFLWYHRGAGFLSHDLPLPGLSGAEVNFWDRFKFSSACKLYFADSHMQIYSPQIHKGLWRGESEIWNYDAHHDAGYRGTVDDFLKAGKVTCADWALAYDTCHGISTKCFYPKWKTWAMESEPDPVYALERQFDDGMPVQKPFHRIFICRSGGWTPVWLDDQFDKFIADCPIPATRKISLDGMKNRQYDPARMQHEFEQTKALMEQFRAKTG